jgi:gas vesicle protein
MTNRDASVGFTAGVIIGAAIGLAVGFLYAPRSGEETREMLKEKAEILKEKAGTIKAKAVDALEQAKLAATEVAKKKQ